MFAAMMEIDVSRATGYWQALRENCTISYYRSLLIRKPENYKIY